MSPKQSKLLKYIRKYVRKNGYAPSYREMAEEMGHSSHTTAWIMCRAMIEDGHLQAGPERDWRNIRLAGDVKRS